ncbi:MAG: aldehyde ferredoxin oxidoreductase N-terminal domain-containing protein, partial [Desulfatiglandales bacterium]
MRYGETGYYLEVDLSCNSIEKVETDPNDTRLYLGGLGTNAKILWEKVGPEVEAFSPENLILFGPGLFVGTPAVGANRTIISSISPQTGLLAFSMMGGFWGPELKYSGFDKVIVKGKAQDLVYLWIHDGTAEIRDARHLRGMSTYETMAAIKKELKDPKAQVLAIGLAGENRVYFASVEASKSSSSRLGLGAVMGAKNLKAVVASGRGDIPIAHPEEFFSFSNTVLQKIKERFQNPIKGVQPINAYFG